MLTRLAKIVIFAVVFAAGVAGLILGNPRQKLQASEDELCRARCGDLHKLHRLAPLAGGKPLLAEHFGCRKADVVIRSGASGRMKLVRLDLPAQRSA
jgi:hypothetical protein